MTLVVPTDLLIGGRWESGEGDQLLSHGPHDGVTLWSGGTAKADQSERAVDAAFQAFTPWRRTSLADRLAVVSRFAALVEHNRAELGALITRETGKPRWDADGEIAALLGKVRVSAEAQAERTGTVQREMGAITVETTHRPLGPMIVLGPFNFPLLLPGGHIIPALLAGNTIVFKPSELTPAVAAATAQLWVEAGVPAGVMNLVYGGAATASALMSHPETRGVLFTGGVAGGRAVRQHLVDRPEVISALELGGNNPLVVWDTKQIHAAARLVVRSAFVSSGQRCLCARRLIVADDESGADLVREIVALTPALRIGDPAGDPQPFAGPLIHAAAAARLLSAQEDLAQAGADVLLAAAALPDLGPAYVSPGIVDVTEVTDLRDEEVFGPLLQVTRVATFEEAITQANATRFGLSAGLISDSPALFDTFRAESTAGLVNFNAATVVASGMAPFGGTGQSGNHRPAGYYAADYCAYPVATCRVPAVADPETLQGVDDAQQ